MKKQIMLTAALILMLTGCQNRGMKAWSPAETSQSAEENMKEESSRAEDSTAATEEGNREEGQKAGEWEEQNRIRPLNVEISAEYEGEWDDKGAIITADSSTVNILDDGYEALKEALKQYNKEQWQEVYTMYTEHREWAKEEAPDDDQEYYISRKIELARADTRVLSFTNTEISYVGGAHESYYEAGETFDPETGKALELTEVVTDYDALYEYVKKSLSENYEKQMFFEEYEDWLYDMFYEQDSAMASPLEWNLNREGIRFRFNPYVIGPWVAGTFYVDIPYEGNEALIREEYAPVRTNGSVTRLAADTPFKLDTDGDGTAEIYTIWTEEDPEYGTTQFMLTREEASGETEKSEEECYGSFADAYLVETGDGRLYLYAEFLEENDFRILRVFDLKPGNGQEVFRYVGDSEESVYGHYLYDPEHFALFGRLDALGTYSGYREYSVGQDGLPVPSGDMYRIVNYFEDYPYVLTAKRELRVRMKQGGKTETEETVLPKGTTFLLTGTDGMTVVEAELEDGRRCEIPIEKDANEYLFKINGISEYDCFDGLRYAG